MVYGNILEAIGHTPLVRINKLVGENDAEVLVKYEGVNVGGSIKTRTAYNMLRAAEEAGLIGEGSVIVEPTSGNQGIGLALVAAVRGYRAIIVMPDSVSGERKKLIEQYGAEVVLVPDEGDIGKCIAACLAMAQKITAETPRAYLPQQFVNPHNPAVHRDATAQEILDDLDGRSVDGFCSGIGTGGTLSGVGEVLKEKFPKIEIWAVEPTEAAILSGGQIGTHVQMGIGDGLIPDNLNTQIYSHVELVTDADALACAKALAKEEGILCGISSGTNLCAALRLAKKLGKGKTVVTILPDTGERYFSTELFGE